MIYLQEMISYLIGLCLMLVSLFTVMLPIFDWLPRALYLLLYKHLIRGKAILICIARVILWAVINTIITVLIFIFVPFLNKHSVYGGSFFYGGITGIIIFISIAILNRKKFDKLFHSFIAPYKINCI